MFAGPYYRYRTYYDLLHIPNDAHVPIYKYAIERVKQLPLIAGVYLVCSFFFNIEVRLPFLNEAFLPLNCTVLMLQLYSAVVII